MTAPDPKKYFPSLDGLRGLCALMVVYVHWAIMFDMPSLPLIAAGSEAVCLFFALSGFLMAYLYSDRPMNRHNVRTYLVHRFARIYPAYIVAVGVTIILTAVPGWSPFYPVEGLGQIIRHVAMVGSTGVFWSISPEIQFYIFFLALWFFARNPQKWQIIAIATAGFICIFSLYGLPGPGILLTSKLAFFVAGAGAGYCYRRGWTPQRGGLAMGLLTLALLGFFFARRDFTRTEDVFSLGSAVTCGLILYCTAIENRVSALVLGLKPVRFLGQISFSLYLFHIPVLSVASHIFSGLPMPWTQILSLVLVFPVATLTNRLIEIPAQAFLVKKFAAKPAL